MQVVLEDKQQAIEFPQLFDGATYTRTITTQHDDFAPKHRVLSTIH